jgi:ribosomal-protein-alanine N-acetyltransferase
MIRFFRRFFAGGAASFSEARRSDAPAIAALHGASFRRGWSENEVETMLGESNILGDRIAARRALIGFILSRFAAEEAEILSIAIDRRWRGRGLARPLLDLHMRRLAGHGVGMLFLEVDETNAAARRLYERAGFREVGRRRSYYPRESGEAASALVLRRDLA